MTLTVADIASQLKTSFEGNGETSITGISGLRDAGQGDITFMSNPRYAAEAEKTKASAVIVPREWDRPCPAALVYVENPDAAFAMIAGLFAPPPVRIEPGIHQTAVVDPEAEIGEDAHIGAYCVIEAGVVIGDRAILYPGCYIGQSTVIGDDCKFYPGVTVREYVKIGHRVIVHNSSVIGSDGFGYTVDEQGVRQKIPQIGTVVICDDVEIGANVTIDRARFGKTYIGKGVKIDNLVQVAHNVVVDENAVLVAQVGIAGSTHIGKGALLGGQAGIAGHLVIGDGAMVGAQAGVTKNVPSRVYVSGYPAAPHEKAAKLHAHLARLPDLKEKVADLEKRIKELEKRLG